jgi:hypothetical protein
MLVSMQKPYWWYMEIPRTGSTSIDRGLRHVFTHAKAIYQKHWPVVPSGTLWFDGKSLVSIRNPYSRAVSCWQYFTKPGDFTFEAWLEQRLADGFCDVYIEARPQAFWFNLVSSWDIVLHQESLQTEFRAVVQELDSSLQGHAYDLKVYNSINGPWTNRVKCLTSRPHPWQSYYTPKAKELVQKLYAEDFEVLQEHYSKEFPS